LLKKFLEHLVEAGEEDQQILKWLSILVFQTREYRIKDKGSKINPLQMDRYSLGKYKIFSMIYKS